MGVSWTPEQKKVIELRKRNILVSAAAGSGKTAVLVERIKERILDKENPIDIDELLVVTFTKAAAAQMRDRVGLAIEKELSEDPLNPRLEQQLALVHNAQITTIDSFCLYVIRNHFHEIDLEPNFRIADEGELKLLKQEVMETLLEEMYEGGSEDFIELADIYASGRNDEGLKSLILQFYDYAGSYPWPKEWLLQCEKAYETETVEELEESPMMQCLLEYISYMTEGVREKMQQTLAVCLQEDGPYMYQSAIESDLSALNELLECKSYEQIRGWMQGKSWAKLKAARGFEGSKEKQEYVKGARSTWKNAIDSIQKKFFFADMESHLAQTKRLHGLVHTLVSVTCLFMERLSMRKREKNIVDFGDLEHFALEILVDRETKQPTATAQEFQNAYAEIMIDEYQDSNYVQETILRAISREQAGENNIFMVGDVKQSIYRFRLARPELFMEKFDAYTTEDSENQRVDLHKNFRSRNEVLQITNDIFKKIMKRSLGNVEYDDAAALYPGASYPEAVSDMNAAGSIMDSVQAASGLAGREMFAPEILVADGKEELLSELEQGDKATLEAMMIASKIKTLMERQLVTDEKTKELRRLRYGDIVLLLRSLSVYGDTFTKVLMEAGIPAHTTSKTGYFSALEVQIILSYLRILDNPFQDIPLAAVLKSPIGGFSDEELAQIRVTDREKSFSEAFFDGIREEIFAGELAGKVTAFYEIYQNLRKEISDRPIHELLLEVLDATGYDKIVAAMPGGKQRQANVAMLVERAIAYEGTSYRGLFHFIRYMDELQKYDVDYGEADLVSENEDAVRIMSIHKSKGLEFPVVFVSGLGKQFNRQDSRSRMILHHELGIGLEEVDMKRHIKMPTLTRRILANQGELENLGEELRILYVALTRAKEKLILTGVLDKADEKLAGYRVVNEDAKKIGFADLAGANSYLDWVLPALVSYGDAYLIQQISLADMVWQEARQQTEERIMEEETASDWERPSEEMKSLVEGRLSYVYPYQNTVDLQMKYSVSELKHRAMREYAQAEELDTVPVFLEKPVIPYIPAFVDETAKREEISQGALRGTAVHRVLECLDFTAVRDESLLEDVDEQMKQMLASEQVTKEMADLVNPRQIVEFLRSDVGRRMRRAAEAGLLYREKPFVLGMPEEELILVQGIIDVFWMEGNHIILLDYKTDRVKDGKQLCDMYQAQLDLYAKALEAVWDMKVEEKYLYSFSLREAVKVEDEQCKGSSF